MKAEQAAKKAREAVRAVARARRLVRQITHEWGGLTQYRLLQDLDYAGAGLDLWRANIEAARDSNQRTGSGGGGNG